MRRWYKLCLLFLCIGNSIGLSAQETVTIKVECEDFQYYGDWNLATSNGRKILCASDGAPCNAATIVNIPESGQYRLWVSTLNFPYHKPAECFFSVSVGGKKNSHSFGATDRYRFGWQQGDIFDLEKGNVLISLIDDNAPKHWGRADAVLLTDDLTWIPEDRVSIPDTPSVDWPQTDSRSLEMTPINWISEQEQTPVISNNKLKVSFLLAERDGKRTYVPKIQIRAGKKWLPLRLDLDAESYQVSKAVDGTRYHQQRFYHSWDNTLQKPLEITVGGVVEKTRDKRKSQVVWSAGDNDECLIRTVNKVEDRKFQLDFYPSKHGQLSAEWFLENDDASHISVRLHFIPASTGEFSLGYTLFADRKLDDVEEILMPVMVQRKRFPKVNYTFLQGQASTPMALMQVRQQGRTLVMGVSGDTEYMPDEFPAISRSRYGMHIRNDAGRVQPAVFGPLFGLPGSEVQAQDTLDFAYNILAQEGNWYDGYRTVADEVFQWSDYRQNAAVSLTQAVYNMIDLYKQDESCGWWPEAKAYYQLESRNGSTQSVPLVDLSLYRLTNDTTILYHRAIPSIEFMLSRKSCSFSVFPNNTGRYNAGSMKGPMTSFGPSVFGNMWKMCDGKTAVLKDVCERESDKVERRKPKVNYDSHRQSFNHYIDRYLLTGKRHYLDLALNLAYDYIDNGIILPPEREIGPEPFFLVDHLPSWEGLLRLYEITGDKKLLEAVQISTRMLMTGIWTQPVPGKGNKVIHKGGHCDAGPAAEVMLFRGAEKFRTGFPIKVGDTPEKTVPSWLVSCVGLGIEQPSTYPNGNAGGKLRFQAPWTPAFLRMAQYTGDPQYEIYARNAVIGRWANYPGYFITTFTDIMQDPNYPYKGPDLTAFYPHHINVHLGWSIDYLVSEAQMKSAGKIHFPSLRQFGYAYFDYNVYGHASGEVYGNDDVWLWFDKELVSLDNPQINYLTAHSGNQFFLILMNESSKEEHLEVSFNLEKISTASSPDKVIELLSGENLNLDQEYKASLLLPSRGLKVIRLDGLSIDVHTHQSVKESSGTDRTYTDKFKNEYGHSFMASKIQFDASEWTAYVWSSADYGTFSQLVLEWKAGERSGLVECNAYPYEFSIPELDEGVEFTYRLRGQTKEGKSFVSSYHTLNTRKINHQGI